MHLAVLTSQYKHTNDIQFYYIDQQKLLQKLPSICCKLVIYPLPSSFSFSHIKNTHQTFRKAQLHIELTLGVIKSNFSRIKQ